MSEREENYDFVCQSIKYSEELFSYMQILFMKNNFKFNHARFRSSIFCQFMTFDIQDNNLNFLPARRWALFVASPFSLKSSFLNVRTHTRSYVVWDKTGFYLMLVIDCKKLISKDGCADIAPATVPTKTPDKQYYRQ